MPLHDWTLVSSNVLRSFHVVWLGHLAGALNGSVLPEGYLARAEEYVGPFQADVLALDADAAPGQAAPRAPSPALQPTATIDPPRFDVRRQRRIAVFSAREERRLAVIELVSPGNKDAERRARWFEEKLLECLAAGLHLLVVDLLPPSPSAPGFAAAVARELGSEAVPAGGLALTSFETQVQPPVVRVYHFPVQVGAALPEAPLFLEPALSVNVPLEATYQAAFDWLPAPDRARLAG